MALRKLKLPLAAFQEAGDTLNAPELDALLNDGYEVRFNLMVAEQKFAGVPPEQYMLVVLHRRDVGIAYATVGNDTVRFLKMPGE